MACILVTEAERHELTVFGVTLGYCEASGDKIVWDVIEGGRDELGRPKQKEVALRVIAEHVTDWHGVDEALWFLEGALVPPGTEGAKRVVRAAEYPATGKIPRPLDGKAGPEHVTDADVAARVRVLRRLPWNVLLKADQAIGKPYVEALESGKD